MSDLALVTIGAPRVAKWFNPRDGVEVVAVELPVLHVTREVGAARLTPAEADKLAAGILGAAEALREIHGRGPLPRRLT